MAADPRQPGAGCISHFATHSGTFTRDMNALLAS